MKKKFLFQKKFYFFFALFTQKSHSVKVRMTDFLLRKDTRTDSERLEQLLKFGIGATFDLQEWAKRGRTCSSNKTMQDKLNLLLEPVRTDVCKLLAMQGLETDSKRRGHLQDVCVYAEIKPESFTKLISRCLPKIDSSNLTFYDLGSGTGKTVFSAAISGHFKSCIGIEILPELAAIATCLNETFVEDINDGTAATTELRLGSFLEDIEWVNAADVIYCNTIMFDEDLMTSLRLLSENMKPGSLFITLGQSLNSSSSSFKIIDTFGTDHSFAGGVDTFVHRKVEVMEEKQTTSTSLRKVEVVEEIATKTNTAGTRYLVHQLKSTAGQLLNGQHITLVDAAMQNGRFRCRFDNGTIKKIKQCNLRKIHEKYDEDPCSICMEVVNIIYPRTFRRSQCCGKVMHLACATQLITSELSVEQRYSCPMCRSRNARVGSKEDIERLQYWVKRGKHWAQHGLGSRYRDGSGVKKNQTRAAELYALAAEQGDADAQCSLGNFYANGRGVIQSDKKAVEWFLLAAEQGQTNAQYNLSVMYGKGHGVEESQPIAVEWLTEAASQGHENAIKMLKQYHELEGRTTVVCSNCNAPATTNRTLIQCGCRAVSYCNSECQKKHWGAHQVQHGQIETYFKLQKVKKIK